MTASAIRARAAGRQSLLIIDQDAILRERLAAALCTRGFDVQLAGDHEQALTLARKQVPDMVLLDAHLEGRSSLTLIAPLRTINAAIEILIWTAYARVGSALDAQRFGALPYLRKPADTDDILFAFSRARLAAQRT